MDHDQEAGSTTEVESSLEPEAETATEADLGDAGKSRDSSYMDPNTL